MEKVIGRLSNLGNEDISLSRKDYIQVITPLRGVASFAVLWFHLAFASSYLAHDHPLATFANFGKYGVQVFFVISGFVLPYSLSKASYRLSNYSTFILKRFIRLEPAYFMTILAVLLISFISSFVPGWSGSFQLDALQIASHLLYLSELLGFKWLVPVFWTLAIEFQFYLLIGLIYPLIANPSRWVRYLVLLLLCFFVILFPTHGATSQKIFVFQHFFLFAYGIAIFWNFNGQCSRKELVGLFIFFSFGCLNTLGLEETIAGLVSSFVIIFFTQKPFGAVLNYLGSISYSLYLVHLPIGDRMQGIVERIDVIPKSLGLLISVVFSIYAAHLLYKYVELPSHKMSQKFSFTRLIHREIPS